MPDHGTRSTYVAGCRCTECTAANAAYASARRADAARLTARAQRSGIAWSAAEDAILLTAPGTVLDRARRLGRTYTAATRRLDRLREVTS